MDTNRHEAEVERWPRNRPGNWDKDLPKETLEGQAQGEDTVPAVGAFVGLGQEVGREDALEEMLQFLQRGVMNLLAGAAARGGQSGPEGGEEGGVPIGRYIYRP